MSLKLALPIALVLLVAAPASLAEDSKPAREPLDTVENCEQRHLDCAADCPRRYSGAVLNECLVNCSNSATYCKRELTRLAPRSRRPSREVKPVVKDAG